jgi:tRNA(adenine34) deaminase
MYFSPVELSQFSPGSYLRLCASLIRIWAASCHPISMQPEDYMARALELAKKAEADGDVPVGAVIVRNGEILATAYNEKEALKVPSCHAEILAIERAALKLDRWRLIDCDLYVTLEPCVMCAGAIVQARLRSVTYGAKDPKAGAVESVYNILSDGKLNHRPLVVSGLLEKECSQMLSDFFAKKRKEDKN